MIKRLQNNISPHHVEDIDPCPSDRHSCRVLPIEPVRNLRYIMDVHNRVNYDVLFLEAFFLAKRDPISQVQVQV